MDKEPDQQDPSRDQVQEETERVEKERSIHIQIKWKYSTKISSRKL